MTTVGRTCPTDRGQAPSPALDPNLISFPESCYWVSSEICMSNILSLSCASTSQNISPQDRVPQTNQLTPDQGDTLLGEDPCTEGPHHLPWIDT